jgi:hypothetical protein
MPSLRNPPPFVIVLGAAATLSRISLPSVPVVMCRVAVTAL